MVGPTVHGQRSVASVRHTLGPISSSCPLQAQARGWGQRLPSRGRLWSPISSLSCWFCCWATPEHSGPVLRGQPSLGSEDTSWSGLGQPRVLHLPPKQEPRLPTGLQGWFWAASSGGLDRPVWPCGWRPLQVGALLQPATTTHVVGAWAGGEGVVQTWWGAVSGKGREWSRQGQGAPSPSPLPQDQLRPHLLDMTPRERDTWTHHGSTPWPHPSVRGTVE